MRKLEYNQFARVHFNDPLADNVKLFVLLVVCNDNLYNRYEMKLYC